MLIKIQSISVKYRVKKNSFSSSSIELKNSSRELLLTSWQRNVKWSGLLCVFRWFRLFAVVNHCLVEFLFVGCQLVWCQSAVFRLILTVFQAFEF
jgi:hypothetical protein